MEPRQQPFHCSVQWNKQQINIELNEAATLRTLKQHLSNTTGIAETSQKLIHKGKNLADQEVQLRDLGAGTAAVPVRLILIGTPSKLLKLNEEIPVKLSKERLRVRDDLSTSISGLRKRPVVGRRSWIGFQRLEVLLNLPEQEKAKAMLEELASDPGVLAVMQKFAWTVGALSEMYPEGQVGISDVCVMGLNENRGQRILLRLRTDDLEGFRKLLSVKKVLYHELAHNVYGDHDDNFYLLMRQIEREVNAFNASGRSLGGHYVPESLIEAETAFAGGSGRLGGESVVLTQQFSATELAGMAAAQRLSDEERRIENGCACGRGGTVKVVRNASEESVPVGQRDKEVFEPPALIAWSRDGVDKAGGRSGGAGTEHQTQDVRKFGEQQDSDAQQEDDTDTAILGVVPPAAPASTSLSRMSHGQHTDGFPKAGLLVPEPILSASGPQFAAQQDSIGPNKESIDQLVAMGFEPAAAVQALRLTQTVEAAANALLLEAGQVSEGATGAGRGEICASRQDRILAAMRQLRQQMVGESEQTRNEVLSVLRTILEQILHHASEDRYKRIRLNNAVFRRSAGRYPAAVDFLVALGFERQTDEKEEVLVLTRNDSGLLWLGTTALEGA